MNLKPLRELLVDVQAGIACGERASDGIIQLRMNNVSITGDLNLSNHLRIPRRYVSHEMMLAPGDVVFNNTNSVELVGKTALFEGYEEPITYSNHFTRLRTDLRCLAPEYLALWFQHLWSTRYFESICDRWIGQAAIQRRKIEALEIQLPPIEDQRCIAARLKAQLAAVEEARQAARAQAEEAEALTRRIREQSLEALEDLPRVVLGELLLGIEAGKSIQTSERLASEHEIGVLKVSAVSWTEFRAKEAKAIDGNYTPDDRHFVKQGDVLISRANTVELVGAVVRVERDYPNRLLSDKTLRLVLDENRVHSNYLIHVLRMPEAREHIEGNATGTSDSMRNISQDTIRAVPVPLPTMEEQIRIANRLNEAESVSKTLNQAIQDQLSEIELLPARLLAQAFEDQ